MFVVWIFLRGPPIARIAEQSSKLQSKGGLQRLVWGRNKHRPRACFHLQHRHRWWYVKDLGSSNGTFLWTSGAQQPQRLPPHQPAALNDGDEVAFGNARFIFRTR